jgi:hypothetical protein
MKRGKKKKQIPIWENYIIQWNKTRETGTHLIGWFSGGKMKNEQQTALYRSLQWWNEIPEPRMSYAQQKLKSSKSMKLFDGKVESWKLNLVESGCLTNSSLFSWPTNLVTAKSKRTGATLSEMSRDMGGGTHRLSLWIHAVKLTIWVYSYL